MGLAHSIYYYQRYFIDRIPVTWETFRDTINTIGRVPLVYHPQERSECMYINFITKTRNFQTFAMRVRLDLS